MYYISKIYRHRIIWAIVIPAISSLFFSLAATSAEPQVMNQYIRFFFYANDPQTEFAMMLTLIVYFVFLCCLTGVFTDDLQTHVTYCFTRKKNIMQWYFSMVALLVALSAIAVLSYTLCGSAIILIFENYPAADFIVELNALLKTIILVWMFVFSTSLFLNVMTLLIKKKYILPTLIVALSFFAAFIPFSIKNENTILLSLNPIVRFNASLHTDILNTPYFEKYANSVNVDVYNLRFWDSFLYFVALSTLAFVIGIIIVKKTDIAMKTEE